MERMQRPGHSEIQLSKVTISGRVLDESGFPLAGATTMFGSLQGGKCCRNDRISIGFGRKIHSGGCR